MILLNIHEIEAQEQMLQEHFSSDTSKEIIALQMELFLALEKFNDCAPNSPDFYQDVKDLMECIDKSRLSLEKAIKTISQNESVDTGVLKNALFERLIEPYFNEISTFSNQQKIIHGMHQNREWLNDVANRTVAHQIGFIKVPIISQGGRDYVISDTGGKSIKMPSIELRLHIYMPSNEDAPGELLHAHGFDLYSRVSAKGALVDQRVNLYENPIDADIKKSADRLGVDIPSYTSEADNLQKSVNKLGLDLPKTSQAKKLHLRETFQFFPKDDKYVLTLVSPMGRTFTNIAQRPIVAEGESVRFHPSEDPHFVISAQGTHTFCVTLRKPGQKEGELFKPSYLLVDSADPGLSKLDSLRSVTKKPVQTIDAAELDLILQKFSDISLTEDIEYAEKLQSLSSEEVMEHKISNLLNHLLADVKRENSTADHGEAIKSIMQLNTKSFVGTNMTLKDSISDPKVFKPIYLAALKERGSDLFEQRYNEKFQASNEKHIELLVNLLPLAPEVDRDVRISAISSGSCG